MNELLDNFARKQAAMITSKFILKLAALFIVIIASFTSAQSQTYKRKLKAHASFRVPMLRNINKIELLSVESRMGNIEKVEATKLVERKEAQNILGVWRKQKLWGYSNAACHQPPYALKSYSKGKMVLSL